MQKNRAYFMNGTTIKALKVPKEIIYSWVIKWQNLILVLCRYNKTAYVLAANGLSQGVA